MSCDVWGITTIAVSRQVLVVGLPLQSGLDDGVKVSLLGVWMALFMIFAARKFTQPIKGDDPIACLNKSMAFLTTVASLSFPSANNQLRTSSNPRNQATIQDGRTKDLDTYDSDCDDISNVKAILMASISNYGFDDFKQPPAVDFTDNEIHSDSNIILYSQYLQETQQENVQDTHLQAQQDSMILSVIEQMKIQRISLTGFPTQSVGSSNNDVYACLFSLPERLKADNTNLASHLPRACLMLAQAGFPSSL
nr:hypothetical protein [Tanacetum cinerariifolium]